MKALRHLATLLATLIASLFVSCCDKSSDDTTYTIYVSTVGTTSASSMNIICYEYNSREEIINQQVWNTVYAGENRKFTASGSAEKIKIQIQYTLSSTGSSDIRWVQQVWYLNAGDDIDINITGTTIVGVEEP